MQCLVKDAVSFSIDVEADKPRYKRGNRERELLLLGGEIGICHNAGECSLLVHNREAADLAFQHELGGVLGRAVLANSDHAVTMISHTIIGNNPCLNQTAELAVVQVILADIDPADFRPAGNSFFRLEQ